LQSLFYLVELPPAGDRFIETLSYLSMFSLRELQALIPIAVSSPNQGATATPAKARVVGRLNGSASARLRDRNPQPKRRKERS
jgi:hypothetical protein